MFRTTSILLLALAAMTPSPAAAGNGLPKPKDFPGVKQIRDVRYLPDDRYVGDPSLRRDNELCLDIYLPESGAGPFPVLLNVHGGGYGGGDKGSGGSLIKPATSKGYAVVGLNYLLRPKDIMPQVFYDIQDALRFLRSNAKKYDLDPTRIGAVGWSAGGWLMSNIAFVGGDALICGLHGDAVTMQDFATGGNGRMSKPWYHVPKGIEKVKGIPGFVFPAWSPRPAWPDQYGQLQAVCYDFSRWRRYVHPAAAAVNHMVGVGFASSKMCDGASGAAPKGRVHYAYSELTGDKYKGKQPHVPKLTEPCLSADGKGEVLLAERIFQFFDREFGPEGRAPAPEIRPFLRVIDDEPVEVRMLVPDASMTIHYTTDGSDPSTSSPVYKAPFVIKGEAVVKALATIKGRRPSGVSIATFIKGPMPPVITAPDQVTLPPAAVGEPYQVAFTATCKEPIAWRLSGEIVPRRPAPRAPKADFMGLTLDRSTGVLSGTPKIGGTWWVQVQASLGPGKIATTRNYLLPINGKGGVVPATDDSGKDTNTEVGTLKHWPQDQVDGLLAVLGKAGLSPVTQDEGEQVLLLVPKDQLEQAGKLTRSFARKAKLTVVAGP